MRIRNRKERTCPNPLKQFPGLDLITLEACGELYEIEKIFTGLRSTAVRQNLRPKERGASHFWTGQRVRY